MQLQNNFLKLSNGLKCFCFFAILLHFSTLALCQSQQPIEKIAIDTLKKNPELWYVDQKFSPDSAQIVFDSLIRYGYTKKPKKAEAVKRDSLPELLNIPQGVFTAMKWLFYLAILAAIIFLILKGNFRVFSTATNTVLDNEITENTNIESADQLQNIGFEQQIATAESQGNYRLAVRLHFLWILKKLINKDFIKFHIKKTNIDYCNELADNEHFTDFSSVSKYYNYVWYGEFAIDTEKYEQIKSSFQQLLSKI